MEIFNHKKKIEYLKDIIEKQKDEIRQWDDDYEALRLDLESKNGELEEKLYELKENLNPQAFLDWLTIQHPNLATEKLTQALNQFYWGKTERIILYK